MCAFRDEDRAAGLPDSVRYLRIQAPATKKSIPTLMKTRGMVVPTDSAAAWTVTFSPARFFLTYIVWFSKFVLSGGIRTTELWFENCGHSVFREMLKTSSKRDAVNPLTTNLGI